MGSSARRSATSTRNVLDRAVEGFTELTGSKPDAYADYRKLLEDDED